MQPGSSGIWPEAPAQSLPARKKCGSSDSEIGVLRLPDTGSPRIGAGNVHAILEGLMQTPEQLMQVKAHALSFEKSMANIASRLHRMLEERDVDGAFALLRRNLWKTKQNHKNRTDKAVVHAETVFRLVLQCYKSSLEIRIHAAAYFTSFVRRFE